MVICFIIDSYFPLVVLDSMNSEGWSSLHLTPGLTPNANGTTEAETRDAISSSSKGGGRGASMELVYPGPSIASPSPSSEDNRNTKTNRPKSETLNTTVDLSDLTDDCGGHLDSNSGVLEKIEIIDVTSTLLLFKTFLKDWSSSSRFSLSLACNKVPDVKADSQTSIGFQESSSQSQPDEKKCELVVHI